MITLEEIKEKTAVVCTRHHYILVNGSAIGVAGKNGRLNMVPFCSIDVVLYAYEDKELSAVYMYRDGEQISMYDIDINNDSISNAGDNTMLNIIKKYGVMDERDLENQQIANELFDNIKNDVKKEFKPASTFNLDYLNKFKSIKIVELKL